MQPKERKREKSMAEIFVVVALVYAGIVEYMNRSME